MSARDPFGIDDPWMARRHVEELEIAARRDANTARWADEPTPLPSPRQVFLSGAWAMLDALKVYGVNRTLPEAAVEALARQYPDTWGTP